MGAWKCQTRSLGSEIYWEFIDHLKVILLGAGRESPCRNLFRMQPLFPISPRARTDIWQICIYMHLHRSNQTSRCRHNSGIQSRIPTSVSAVTNTHSPRKRGWGGALSLEQITFKPQRSSKQTAYSSTGQVTCSCYSWSVSSK